MMDDLMTRAETVGVARVRGVDGQGRPLVELERAPGEIHVVDVVWTDPAPAWGRCIGLRVALGFIDGDRGLPFVVGLLDPPPAETPEVLRLEGRKEVVIECGKAKIALRADGRIEIRGGYLISRATGPNKIKGGSVHIN